MLFLVLPDLLSSPLHITDPADCRPPTTTGITGGEEEPAVNLPDVLEHQLLAGFQPEVPAELTAPAEEVGGQQDGGGEAALLRHPVGLQQVGLDALVSQEGQSQAGELKYPEIIFFSAAQDRAGCFKPTLQTAHRNASA